MSAPRNDNATGQGGEDANKSKLNPHNTSASNARQIILRALRMGPKTTIQLREQHGIMSPAPRVLELRERGYAIDTVRVLDATVDGIRHIAVAKYVLQSEAEA